MIIEYVFLLPGSSIGNYGKDIPWNFRTLIIKGAPLLPCVMSNPIFTSTKNIHGVV